MSGNAYGKVGKGNFQMKSQSLKNFIEYLRNEYATSFVVSKDGNFSTYGICGAKICQGGPGATSTLLKYCKRETGSKCYIFAQRKNKKKIIRWNKVDYIFPSEEWNYNEWQTKPTSDDLGIKKNISDEQIKAILANLEFINQTSSLAAIDINISKTEETNNDNRKYFCISVAENPKYKYFAESKQYKKYWKKDCKNYALYIVYKDEHPKLYKSLARKYKNISSPIYPSKKLNKKLFALVAEQTPKNIIELKEEVKETIEPNKTSTAKKVEKKMNLSKEQQNEIDQIKGMFKIGALTKDEYNAAIQRVLN